MDKRIEFESYSYDETTAFASDFVKELTNGSVICMYGDLGAGKTAFVQGLAKGLGVTEYITSPTFTIVNVYESGTMPLYHFDMYRIEDSDEAYEIGYEEYVYGDGVSVIEWTERIEDILPDSYLRVEILKDTAVDDNYRKILIEKVEK